MYLSMKVSRYHQIEGFTSVMDGWKFMDPLEAKFEYSFFWEGVKLLNKNYYLALHIQ